MPNLEKMNTTLADVESELKGRILDRYMQSDEMEAGEDEDDEGGEADDSPSQDEGRTVMTGGEVVYDNQDDQIAKAAVEARAKMQRKYTDLAAGSPYGDEKRAPRANMSGGGV